MERRRCRRAVQGLLRSCYAEVLPLEGFVRRLQAQAESHPEPLVKEDDLKCYRSLVDHCLVGRPAGCKAPPLFTFQQVSNHNDVVARVIRRICEKKKKNVLAFGYGLLNENNHQLLWMPNICSHMPNNTSQTILQSVLWEMVLRRVGDDVMMYLLEHCALFMLVPPSCCYQICGQPIYELALRSATPSSEFVRHRYPRQTHSVFSSYLQGRFRSCRQYVAKANWRKWNSRKQRWCKIQVDLDRNCQQSSVIQRAAGLSPTMNKVVTRPSDYLESQPIPSQCLPLTAPFLKRKWKGGCEISAKRMKIMHTEEGLEKETRIPVPPESNKQLILGGGGNTFGGCVRLHSEEQLGLVTTVLQKSKCGAQTSDCTALDNQEGFFCGRALKLSSESKALSDSSSKTKSHTWGPKVAPGASDACPGQLVTAENAAADRSLKACTSKPVWESSNRISVPAVRIERRSLLYSRWQLKERLPKSFVLNRLKSYPAGGWRLVETIFLHSKILKQPGNSGLPCCNRKKKWLPKRYWQMRGVFQELLQNHAKCPYLVVLKKSCPIWVSELDKIGPGGLSYEQKGHQEGEGLTRRQEANTAENCPRSMPCGLGPFSEASGVSYRSFEKVELSQKGSKEQPPRDSSSSDVVTFLKQHSSHWQVYTFVRDCLERVVPAALWGSNRNKCRFYKNVKRFISLGKFATFSLQELVWKMRVSDCAWLRLTKDHGRFVPASEHRFREDLMSKFLYWLMDSYVAELLRSFFYITETMFQKNLLFFFRKTIWRKLERIGVRSHLTKVHLRTLLEEEIETLQQRKCVPLASTLRFIPKPNGLRPVVKVNSVVGAETFSKTLRDQKVQYFNIQLKNLFSVLNYERIKNPILLGSSVFGKDDIYAAWKKFILKALELNGEMPRFYFVKADVTGAYDTIPHNKLVEVILQMLAPDKKSSYKIRRYAVIMKTRNGLMRRYYKRHVSTSEEFRPDMKQFVCHLQQSTSLRNAVIVEQSLSLKESRSSLCEFFLQLIHNSILKIEERYYVQCCGIPQGSILSTLLCNLCYGDMENKLLCGVQKDGVLMRLTDDFLLATPHLTEAKRFLRTLAMGIPEYGFVINPAKTVVNFPVDEDVPGCSDFQQLSAHSVIPWCGLLIDTQTLEIYCDYSSYACKSIRSSLSFKSSSKAGVSMRNKLLVVLQLKCHSLFLDLQVNSLRTVCVNIFKILLLQAYRFHACVLQLPFNHQIKNNPGFFLRIISDTASCCFSVLKAKNAEIAFSPVDASAPLTYEAVQWLSCHAFSIKLANHRVIYKCLLLPLKQCNRHFKQLETLVAIMCSFKMRVQMSLGVKECDGVCHASQRHCSGEKWLSSF
ncbi:telomerase reverse transcriptase isoform X2 [Rhineura floridana]|uniref:telomerase reverse transcriptase isoform X2 n=1 Tax=Rhineura floridana TaxID=261503 RepID=UPI002AC82606|nr:telomerase reverse transcriptase isoform X2 [Rhineura floridana]